MNPVDLKQKFDAGEKLILLDVREDDERKTCKIEPPAGVVDLHIPMSTFGERFEEARNAAALGLPIVLYCHHGGRSMTVAGWLSRRKIKNVHNLDGGIDRWSMQVDPSVPRY